MFTSRTFASTDLVALLTLRQEQMSVTFSDLHPPMKHHGSSQTRSVPADNLFYPPTTHDATNRWETSLEHPFEGTVTAPTSHITPQPILEDDRKLFDNFDRLVQGEIDQKTFQAAYCKRLLFTWEWVLHLCFLNYNQALKTWYQLLRETRDDDIWLWVNGDEQQSHARCLISPHNSEGPTDLYPSCALSQADLGKAIEILRLRFEKNYKGSTSPTSWRLQLESCGKPVLRFTTVAFVIAKSRSIRDLDGDRGIKDRLVWSLFGALGHQFPIEHREGADSSFRHWQRYIARLKNAGHTCSLCRSYPLNTYSLFRDHLGSWLFEFLEITNPGHQIQAPSGHPLYSIGYYSSDRCLECEKERPLSLSDISLTPIRKNGSREESLVEKTIGAYTPKPFLRLLWWAWTEWRNGCEPARELTDTFKSEWQQWLSLLAELTIKKDSEGNHWGAPGPTLPVRHLLSHRMEEYLQSSGIWDSLLRKQCLTPTKICTLSRCWGSKDWVMYRLSSEEWKAAEAIFGDLTAWYGNKDLVEPQAVCRVFFWWASIKGIAKEFPSYYHFVDEPRLLFPYEWLEPASKSSSLRLKTWLQNEKPACCPGFDEKTLSWYLASVTLLVPESAISAEMVWGCRCDRVDEDEVIRTLGTYLPSNYSFEDRDEHEYYGLMLDRMIDTIEERGIKHPLLKARKRYSDWEAADWDDVSEGGNDQISEFSHEQDIIPQVLQTENPTETGEKNEDHPAPRFSVDDLATLDKTELEALAKAVSRELEKRSSVAPFAPSSPPPCPAPSQEKKNLSKSSQVEHIKKYLIGLLKDLEASTRSILELIPRGKQKESSLPWKSLPQILLERGYELENWPGEVPIPGSGSELCDDNKGIHGLNAKHLRMLYDASQDGQRKLRFRKIVERGGTRRREESDDGETEAGPSQRRRIQ